ncbi:hypothetical protein F4804DRAFT_230301 [Jackrogersella minutella]|nr:hypothetical protein F4804DRAFT_230301 [Jackrogersella minutella]
MPLHQKLPALLNSSILPAQRKPILLAAGLALASTPLLAYAYSCYTQWLALGKGGVPYNFLGWLAQSSLHALARSDTRAPVPRPYKNVQDVGAALYGPAGARTYLAGAPQPEPRAGPRPNVPGFVAPQRQTSHPPPNGTVARLTGFLKALADANPDLFELKESGLEGPPHMALWLRDPRPETLRLGRGANGEWAHVHGEGSAHVTLSPADAAAVIGGGWAERHRMSGVGGSRAMVPWGYVMLYAPRDEGELGVWREVLLAGARYVVEGRGVAVVVPE